MIIKGITETEVSVQPVDLAKVFVTQMSYREKVEFFSWIGRLYGKDSYMKAMLEEVISAINSYENVDGFDDSSYAYNFFRCIKEEFENSKKNK